MLAHSTRRWPKGHSLGLFRSMGDTWLHLSYALEAFLAHATMHKNHISMPMPSRWCIKKKHRQPCVSHSSVTNLIKENNSYFLLSSHPFVHEQYSRCKKILEPYRTSLQVIRPLQRSWLHSEGKLWHQWEQRYPKKVKQSNQCAQIGKGI